MAEFDRTAEDIGNIVTMEHVNVRVPDQQLGVTFYVTALGLTRDPYLMTGVTNMWINAGRSQFHLPTGGAQVLRGVTGLVIPGRDALLQRLHAAADALTGTAFSFKERPDHVAVTCPWGNRIRVHEPSERFGAMRLGMPYVEVDAPLGSANGIVKFYNEIMNTGARAAEGAAHVSSGDGQMLIYRETDAPQPDYDGHHIAVYLADFSGPYNRLLERGLISEESDQHQYRFLDVVDPVSGDALVRLEHEVRSMRHPMYARPLLNRDPAITNRSYAPGHQEMAWAARPG
jgi:hypothetical protein